MQTPTWFVAVVSDDGLLEASEIVVADIPFEFSSIQHAFDEPTIYFVKVTNRLEIPLNQKEFYQNPEPTPFQTKPSNWHEMCVWDQ